MIFVLNCQLSTKKNRLRVRKSVGDDLSSVAFAPTSEWCIGGTWSKHHKSVTIAEEELFNF